MYYGRKKGIIIAIIVIAMILIIGIGGTCLYMFTDLFKSEKTLFWKYMSNGVSNLQIEENTQLEDIQKMKEQSPYNINGELKISSTNEEMNTILEKIRLKTTGKTDKLNNYSYNNTILQNNNTDIFKLEYVQDDNIYALKSDEIVTAYLGVKNENLKVLFQKLGVTDVENIPNEIENINYMELLKFSKEEIVNLKATYTPVIENSIKSESYSKQTEAVIQKDGVSYTTTAYRLDLTGTQISEILVNILNALKEDSRTLDLIATKLNTISNENITIEDVNNGIDYIIEKIQETEIMNDIAIVVYNYKGETIATELLIKNVSKITMYANNNTLKITLENLIEDSNYNVINIEIINAVAPTETNISITVNIDDETETILNITNSGSAVEKKLDTTYDLSITYDNETLEAEYTKQLEFVNELEDIQRLDETNCAILNDYSQQDLASLMEALVNQIMFVYSQKVQMISTQNTIQQ